MGSAMVNTLRSVYGSDVVIAAGYSFTSPIMKTNYSDRMLQYMIMPNNLESFTSQISGEQLQKILRLYVEGVAGFVRGRHMVRKDWLEYFKAGRSLQEPTSYVQITEN